MTVTPAHHNDPTVAEARGFTRRQVTAGAAWAAPVIALAVATPLAAASDVPVQQPSTFVSGSIQASSTPTARIGTYGGGNVTYYNLGSSLTTGPLTVEILSTTPNFVISYDEAAFAAAGWVLTSSSAQVITFTGPELSGGQSRTIPPVTFTGAAGARGTVSVDVYATNPDIPSVPQSAVFR
jgi:hypothetical protein